MKFQRWNMRETDESAVRALMDAGYPYLISAVLAPRGICTPEQADQALRQDEELSLDPMDMKDMDRAVARIRRALDAGEKIAVFGDYDVDGITATCLVTDALERAGADCVSYIPHRIDDGYGLNSEALQKLKDGGVSLQWTAASPAWKRPLSQRRSDWIWSSPITMNVRILCPTRKRW